GEVVKIENTKRIYHHGLLSSQMIEKQEYDFDELNRLKETRLYDKKGKVISRKKYEYYGGTKFLSVCGERKGKPDTKTLYTYSSDSLVKEVKDFNAKEGSWKLYSNFLYTYYPDKKPKSTVYYVKNRLRHKWNYDCDAKGELVKKDTTVICTSESLDAKGRKI